MKPFTRFPWHEVDFEDDPITIEIGMSNAVVEILGNECLGIAEHFQKILALFLAEPIEESHQTW